MESPPQLLWLVLLTLMGVGMYGAIKPLPAGVSMTGEVYQLSADSVHFFRDVTYVDFDGTRHLEQEIFDEVLRMIAEAQHYILIDMFLYNDFLGTETSAHRYLSDELTAALVAKKTENPEIAIQVITDPINTMYGGHVSTQFESLDARGIPVIVTDLTVLRDSNPLYSAWWRTFFQWLGSNPGGFLPNPLDADSPSIGVRAYLKLLNYKANHRKIVVADYEKDGRRGLATLITSANPHDGSSAHSNTALRVDDGVWRDVVESERAVADFSGKPFVAPPSKLTEAVSNRQGDVLVHVVTEEEIETEVLGAIDSLNSGDTLDIAMFYLADRTVIQALKAADTRGVTARLLLDPSKDAFGRLKNGMPNRQVAHELRQHTSGNTQIRWCDTHGEQCHSKMLLARSEAGVTFIQGSANFTRRNLNNFNLETSVVVRAHKHTPAIQKAQMLFEQTWGNEPGKTYSTDYATYADDSLLKTVSYRLKEFTGVSRW